MIHPLLTCLFLAVPTTSNGDPSIIKLPNKPDAVVIEFAFKGGFTPPRKNDRPNMIVKADGTVVVNNPFTGATKKITISEKQLQELMRLIVGQHAFFDFDPDKVQQRVQDEARRTGAFLGIADAATTHVTIRTAEKEHEAHFYALSFHAGMFKTIQPLQDLVAIENRLKTLMNLAWVGGEDPLKSFLDRANTNLKEQFPDLTPLAPNDLGHVDAPADADQALTVHFRRQGDQPDDFLEVILTRSRDGDPTLQRITRRMTPEDYNTWTGNKNAFAGLLRSVNAEVNEKFPTVDALVEKDLQTILWSNGDIRATFRREGKNEGEFIFASIQKSVKGEPTVQVNGRVK